MIRIVIVALLCLALLFAIPAIARADVADDVCSMLDGDFTMAQIEDYVIETVPITGPYARFDAAVLAQKLAYRNCPEHINDFGSI